MKTMLQAPDARTQGAMINDVIAFFKKHHKVEDTDRYWDSVVDDVKALCEKYKEYSYIPDGEKQPVSIMFDMLMPHVDLFEAMGRQIRTQKTA